MDIFSAFDGPAPCKKSKRSSSKKATRESLPSETKLKGIVVRVTEKALLFFDDGSGHEVFLPVAKVLDWWFTSSGSKRHLRIVDLELDDEITVLIPTWLARKEKLL